MEFIELQKMTPREMAKGVKVRFVHSGSMTVAYWEIDAGSSVPEHSHPHEQIMTVLEGQITFFLGAETQKMGEGSAVVIQPNVPHGGEAIVNCRLLDVFHPVREDYR